MNLVPILFGNTLVLLSLNKQVICPCPLILGSPALALFRPSKLSLKALNGQLLLLDDLLRLFKVRLLLLRGNCANRHSRFFALPLGASPVLREDRLTEGLGALRVAHFIEDTNASGATRRADRTLLGGTSFRDVGNDHCHVVSLFLSLRRTLVVPLPENSFVRVGTPTLSLRGVVLFK